MTTPRRATLSALACVGILVVGSSIGHAAHGSGCRPICRALIRHECSDAFSFCVLRKVYRKTRAAVLRQCRTDGPAACQMADACDRTCDAVAGQCASAIGENAGGSDRCDAIVFAQCEQNGAAYCASKGGVGMLTKAMALDYAQRGIRVNAICCGEIDTPLFERESYQIGMTPDSYRELLNEYHPIGRIGLPSEAAAAVAFLASDDASFVTGVLLPVDGGYSAT